MNTIEAKLVAIWAHASIATSDEALCRARWSIALDRIGLLIAGDGSTAHDIESATAAWDIAAFHRYDYSTTPPGI